LSAHFQFLREQAFASKVRAIVEQLDKYILQGEPLYHRVDVKLMTPPNSFDQSEGLLRQLLDIDHFQYHGTARFNALWLPTDIEQLADYSADEIKYFETLNSDAYQFATFQTKRRREPRAEVPVHRPNVPPVFRRLIANPIVWRMIHVATNVWIAVYWSRLLRKPFYFLKYQFEKRLRRK
jgi:hypothetical protein